MIARMKQFFSVDLGKLNSCFFYSLSYRLYSLFFTVLKTSTIRIDIPLHIFEGHNVAVFDVCMKMKFITLLMSQLNV